MWVEFIADFRWRALVGTVIRYKAGAKLCVTRGCGAAAIAAGAAKKSTNPKAKNGTRNNDSRSGEA